MQNMMEDKIKTPNKILFFSFWSSFLLKFPSNSLISTFLRAIPGISITDLMICFKQQFAESKRQVKKGL